ncbi:MAG: GNAT family N-acetyltransferase [Anaerolineae bacterium]|nr:GNAT family N-acetyltransferase [Anaerolineae bacterium]
MTLNWQDRYQPRREPDRTLRLMTPADIPAAVALSSSVGWPQRLADWQRLLTWSPEGCFVIDETDRGIVGTVTTTVYGMALAWIGMMIVAPDRQRRGLGHRLMRAALDYLIARGTERIMLDATAVGRPLYRELGFRDLGKVERWEGRASTYLGPRARALTPGDTTAVLELDRQLFGLPRPHILIRLMEEFPAMGWVDDQRGTLEGYLLARPVGDAVYLGPWMSWSGTSAERLLLAAMEQLQGQQLVMNIPVNNGRGLILAQNHNLRRVRHCMRMIYGEARPIEGELLAQLSVAALATG